MTPILCDRCGAELKVGDYPFCSETRDHSPATTNVITDDIPGGIDIRHGLCWPDGTPRRFYSKSDIAKAAKEKGLINRVEHVPTPGSDKSPVTKPWY